MAGCAAALADWVGRSGGRTAGPGAAPFTLLPARLWSELGGCWGLLLLLGVLLTDAAAAAGAALLLGGMLPLPPSLLLPLPLPEGLLLVVALLELPLPALLPPLLPLLPVVAKGSFSKFDSSSLLLMLHCSMLRAGLPAPAGG